MLHRDVSRYTDTFNGIQHHVPLTIPSSLTARRDSVWPTVRFALLLTLLACLFAPTAGATTLTGTIKDPAGNGLNGRLFLTLSQQADQLSTGGCGGPNVVAPLQIIFAITNGSLPGGAAVVGNDCLAPSGTYYIAQIRDANNNLLSNLAWTITGATEDVSNIPTSIVPNGSVTIVQVNATTIQSVTVNTTNFNTTNINTTNITVTGTCTGCSGLSGMTSGQIPVASGAATINSSKPQQGTDANILTASSVTNGALVCGDSNLGVGPAATNCAQYTKFECEGGLGDGNNAIASGTYIQLACVNKSGVTWTITSIACYVDGGSSSTLNAANNAGTGLLTGPVTCSTTKTGGGAAGTQSGTTTLANNDAINFTFVADGTAKTTTWTVGFTQ